MKIHIWQLWVGDQFTLLPKRKTYPKDALLAPRKGHLGWASCWAKDAHISKKIHVPLSKLSLWEGSVSLQLLRREPMWASHWCFIAPDYRTCTFSSQLLYVKLPLHHRAIKKDPFGGCREGTGISSQLLVGPELDNHWKTRKLVFYLTYE